jgi:hypothetical protein
VGYKLQRKKNQTAVTRDVHKKTIQRNGFTNINTTDKTSTMPSTEIPVRYHQSQPISKINRICTNFSRRNV